VLSQKLHIKGLRVIEILSIPLIRTQMAQIPIIVVEMQHPNQMLLSGIGRRRAYKTPD
jgi:hypothetical protein